MQPKLARRVEALVAERTPFVVATVVRAQRPTSVHPGDSGIVLGDGTIEGFVGGACAETSVRLQALRSLETGEALLLRIVPEGDESAAAAEGAMVVRNPCLSGGALEIFLEPRLPAPRIAIVGETPIGNAIAAIAEQLGYDAAITAGAAREVSDDAALVIASHGHDEPEAIEAGLKAHVPYIGLVASRKRGRAVIEELRERGVKELERVRTPAGLDIGAATAEEIALSIVAEIVASRQVHPVESVAKSGVDPVCGMTVAVTEATPKTEYQGRAIYFCCDGCRNTFEQDPARYAAALG
jgi:xanthine dehydrogenase accessory factor